MPYQYEHEELYYHYFATFHIKFQNIDMASGTCDLEMKIDEEYYYEILSELTGMTIDSEYSLIDTIKTFAEQKNMYCKIADAFMQVKNCGYGIIIPDDVGMRGVREVEQTERPPFAY